MSQYPPPTPTRQGLHKFKVVGMTFVPGYPENLLGLARIEAENPSATEGFAAVAIRNPKNPYDANAIELHVTSVGMIGHVPRQIAAEIAPTMDAGQNYHVRVWSSIDPAHLDKPGALAELRPV